MEELLRRFGVFPGDLSAAHHGYRGVGEVSGKLLEPVVPKWQGVLGDVDQDATAGKPGAEVPRPAVVEFMGRYLHQPHRETLRCGHRAIAGAGVYDDDLIIAVEILRKQALEQSLPAFAGVFGEHNDACIHVSEPVSHVELLWW